MIQQAGRAPCASIVTRASTAPARVGTRFNSSIRGFGTTSDVEVRFGTHARTDMLTGCDALAASVGATLGPKGRNVVIEQPYGPPKITKDGVTVAKSITLKDKAANIGASLVKQVAQSTNDNAGDGTTTATVLACSMFRESCLAVASGMNPMDLLRGMNLATKVVREFLEKESRPVSTREEILNVATVSANGDREIGSLIAKAFDKVGRDGTITVAEGRTMNHDLVFVDGYQFDRGYMAPYFMTNSKTQKCEMDNAYVLVCDRKISLIAQILPLLEQAAQTHASLLIIAEDIESEVLATLVLNKMRGGLNVCAVKAPGFGDYRRSQMEDIAALCGSSLVTEESHPRMDELRLENLGYVKKVTVGKDETLLLEGGSSRDKLDERVSIIKYQLEHDNASLSEYEADKLRERLSKLSGGVAIIKVGGASEIEVGETKDRVKDALCATRAAISDGVLPGGGTGLLFASEELKNLKGANNDQDCGVKIVEKACRMPISTIARNAGFDGAVVAADVLRDHKLGWGFDAQSGQYVDMISAGILDPTKVVKCAISDATSVASLMATTEVIVHNAEKKQESRESGMF